MKKLSISLGLLLSASLSSATVVQTISTSPVKSSSVSGTIEHYSPDQSIKFTDSTVESVPSKTHYNFETGVLSSDIKITNVINSISGEATMMLSSTLNVNFVNKTGKVHITNCQVNNLPSNIDVMCPPESNQKIPLNNIQFQTIPLQANEIAGGNFYSYINFTAESSSDLSYEKYNFSLKLLSVDDNGQLLFDGDLVPAEVPLPAGVWLFGSALLGLTTLRKK